MQQADADTEKPRPGAVNAPLNDPRTGLAGPSIFALEGARNLAFARRHCTDLAVLYLRLDGMRHALREPRGLLSGILERQFVRCLHAAVRTEDTIARLDDERFAVVARETNAIGARMVTRRVLRGLRDARGLPESLRQVSVGIATPRAYRCRDFSDYEVLAARCLQTAIGAGGNRVVAARTEENLRHLPASIPPVSDASRPEPAPRVDVTMWLIEEGFIDQVEPDATAAERFAPLLGDGQQQARVDLGDMRVQLTRSA